MFRIVTVQLVAFALLLPCVTLAVPGDAENDEGVQKWVAGDWNGAEERLTLALKLNPDHAEARYNLGVIQLNRWRLDDSIRTFREVLRSNSQNADAHFELGRALLRKRDWLAAAEEFRSTIKVRPGRAEAYCALGICQIELQHQDEAMVSLNEAIRLAPQHVEAHLQLARALMRREEFDDAREHLLLATKLRPDDADIQLEQGRCLAALGQLDMAIASYREALRLRPESIEAMTALSKILATRKDEQRPQEAVELATRAYDIARRQEPLLLENIATAKAAIGQFSGAVESERAALAAAQTLKDPALVKEIGRRLLALEKEAREKA